jgi:hypothetical protein
MNNQIVKKNQTNRMYLPTLLGVLLLFLSDHFSDFSRSAFSIEHFYPIETVDFRPDSSNSSQSRVPYSAAKPMVRPFQARTCDFTIFQRLSEHLSSLTTTLHKIQSAHFQSIENENILSFIPHNTSSLSEEGSRVS